MSTNPDPGSKKSSGADFTSKTHKDTYAFIDSTKASLAGARVFITGATGHIGKATAVSYARAGAAAIALGARSDLSETVDAVRAAAVAAGHPAPKVLALKVDVTSRTSVDAAAATLKAELQTIDILINNAAAISKWLPVTETDPDAWWATWEANVKGPYLVTRALLPLVLASQQKTIIGVSSVGEHLLMPGASAYQTSKLALHRFMEFVQADYRDQGVLCYVVHPGSVPSKLALGGVPEHLVHHLIDKPELAGDTMVFLTRERRDWLAGRYVSASWDMEEFVGLRAEVEKGDLLKVRMAVQ